MSAIDLSGPAGSEQCTEIRLDEIGADSAKERGMYSASVDRANPGCYLFVIDQSASMEDPIGGQGQAKAAQAASALNRFLQNLTIACTKEDGVRDYFDVGIIRYSGNTAESGFGGVLAGRDLVPLSEVANNPVRVEQRKKDDGAGGIVDFLLPIWIDPSPQGQTPMNAALRRANELLTPWVQSHPSSFPPIVLHFTDGASTDGDPREQARQLTQLQTHDGSALLFNCHLSASPATPHMFPATAEQAPDEYAGLLFEMSSLLPSGCRERASELGVDAKAGARGYVFNADPVSLVEFIEIGTRAVATPR